ncbi:DMT family transporter [uncultured Clostridium sp.]|uniref:DMT family transporter n=1 Tax=uncultured Clostridium sp. TaxID=59620 RepID=UPI0025D5328E|nr:DMT family transporter [uncultured Clostridium sp.]
MLSRTHFGVEPEKLTYKKILAVIASLIGVTIVAINGNIHSLAGGNLKGVLYCLIAAVCYALYASLNKKQTYPKELSMFIVFAVTSVISVVCTIMNGSIGQIAHLNSGMWIGIFYSGIFINAVGYTSWMLALEYGNTAVISNLAYLVPFLSMIFAGIVLKEEISIYSIVGIFMIIGGILLQIREA